ncbi:MAG: TrkH family potassium uptake protein [Rikenellaceae bacterium]
MRPSVVLRYMGVVMLFLSLAMLASAIVSFVSSRDSSFYPLLLSAMLTALLGVFPMIFVEPTSQITNKESYTIVVGSWLLACLVTTFPYLMWGGEFTVVNAWFESVSGLTTTGASILTDIEALPRGLLFWRMSSTWIGGIGIIMFALMILPTIGKTLSNVELSSIAKEHYRYRTQIIVQIILVVYMGLTAITAVSLKLAGMNWFDALTHAMSTSATSGFSTKNSSIAYFDSVPIEMIIIFGMMAAGTHFGLIYATVTGKHNNIFRSEVMRVYVGLTVVASALVSLNLFFTDYYSSIFKAIRMGTFQFVSLVTTTGFAIADSNPWPSFAVTILIFGSIVCACSGSTTGGIKVNRLMLVYKMFKSKIAQQQHPNAVLRIRVDGVIQDQNSLYTVAVFVILYLMLLLFGTLFGSLFGLDVTTAFTSSIACLGNVGPGFGQVGSMDNYSALPSVVKLCQTLLMLFGRLEIFGLIQIFLIRSWR